MFQPNMNDLITVPLINSLNPRHKIIMREYLQSMDNEFNRCNSGLLSINQAELCNYLRNQVC